ncbi:hypothetical protein SKAU_G00353350 [Synaphobranchus kaupii]|uniref:Uncharacterized protein n=1 Tax=Synaphobranchus kaupii TaxID=118154 RepID=A0A9Q1EL23_SYNKA|nr:hypothetical protein SKAU_G00353350 [Synaphobranchus kaupii]
MPRKNKQYSKEVLGVAVEEVKAGASLRKTAQKYGIPHTTLADYKKNTYSHNPHPNSALTPAEEEALLSFIFWMADHGFPITRSLVKALAIRIIRESGRSNTTRVNLEKGPSDMWWSRFKARHPALTMRTADSLDRARVHGATPEAIEGFFSIYEALYIQHDLKNKPHLIFNCDETGFGDKPRSREKVLCQTRRRHIYQQQQTTQQHITVHCCVSAAGESIPPFIIFPGCLPSTAYKLDGPSNALYGIQQKGYMDGELFLKWLHHFIRYAPEERPIILIMDQHETHVLKEVIVLCRDNKIEILCLPAHTTHVLQPLDIAVFNPLKTAFSKMASRMGLVRGDLVVGKKQFSPLLKHVYPTAVTAENVKAGFRKAGIFPLSREAVDTAQVVRILPSAEGTDATPATSSPTPSSTPTTPPAIATPSSTPTTASATPSSASTTSASASAPLTGTNMSATPAPCPTCKRVTPKNYLVAAGILPESLANVFMSPALEKQDKVRRRLPLPARVITSDEYFNLVAQKEAEEKEKEDKKKKQKEDMAKKKEERRQAQEERRQVQEAKRQRKQAPPPAEQDGEHCTICRCLVPPGSADDTVDEWVQCEICQLWFHLQCAEVMEVPDTEWLCMKCCLHP